MLRAVTDSDMARTESTADQPAGSPRRAIRACQNCRRQKMRCDGSPEESCRRCIKVGQTCVFDASDSSRRRSEQAGPAPKRPRLNDLEQEIQQLKHNISVLTGNSEPSTTIPRSLERLSHPSRSPKIANAKSTELSAFISYPESTTGGRHSVSKLERPLASRAISTDFLGAVDIAHTNSPVISQRNCDSTRSRRRSISSVEVGHLRAPVTAVHAKGLDRDTLHDEMVQRLKSSPPATPHHEPASKAKQTSNSNKAAEDVITKMFPSEEDARTLVTRYMAGVNLFLPLFDPVRDNFDSLRSRSPFCLMSILTVALRQTRAESTATQLLFSACQSEIYGMASKTLFEIPTTLENVQGMIILAAYEEKGWFAIGHAHQMACDLGLDGALKDLVVGGSAHDRAQPFQKRNRRLARQARTWLILYHIEREIAFDTARRSRLVEIDPTSLELFLEHQAASVSDMQFLSTIELAQIRGILQTELEGKRRIAGSVESIMIDVGYSVNQWYDKWDELHQAHDYDESCFQRSSLKIQKNFALIIVSCMILGNLQKEMSQLSMDPKGGSLAAEINNLVERTTKLITEQLIWLSSSRSYKWQFQWAPTHSALMLAFLTSFDLKLALKWPTLVDGASLRAATTSASALLENYPYPKLYRVVRKMIAKVSELEQASGGGSDAGPDAFRRTDVANEASSSLTQTQHDQHSRGEKLRRGLEDNVDLAESSENLFEDWTIDRSFVDAWGFPELGSAKSRGTVVPNKVKRLQSRQELGKHPVHAVNIFNFCDTASFELSLTPPSPAPPRTSQTPNRRDAGTLLCIPNALNLSTVYPGNSLSCKFSFMLFAVTLVGRTTWIFPGCILSSFPTEYATQSLTVFGPLVWLSPRGLYTLIKIPAGLAVGHDLNGALISFMAGFRMQALTKLLEAPKIEVWVTDGSRAL